MIPIGIIDDHEIFRESLVYLIESTGKYSVSFCVEGSVEVLDLIKEKKPRIIIMDFLMPKINGDELTKEILHKFPEQKIIALSGFTDEKHYMKMVEAGVDGFVYKKSGKEELLSSIEYILKGENYFSKEILQSIIRLMSTKKEQQKKQTIDLTEREQQVLKLICQGYSNNEIGEILSLSSKTIDSHRTNLLKKTGSKNSSHLVLIAIKNNLVDLKNI